MRTRKNGGERSLPAVSLIPPYALIFFSFPS